ncbi:MAG: homoserine dehydrogenase, partial [Oscillospiraceae bacterium]
MIKIAVMGYGVVGSGVVELVGGHKELLKKALGEEISVKKILVRREYKECSVSELFTQKVEDIIEDDKISVVVEAIGGVNPALNYVSWALEKGKSVVTSNKELIATHGYELMQLA